MAKKKSNTPSTSTPSTSTPSTSTPSTPAISLQEFAGQLLTFKAVKAALKAKDPELKGKALEKAAEEIVTAEIKERKKAGHALVEASKTLGMYAKAGRSNFTLYGRI